MKNAEQWKPTKFEMHNGTLRASRNPAEVNPASRVVADAVGALYSEHIPKYAHGTLLDLGCGKVPFYGAYKQYVEDVTAVDWENSAHVNPFLDAFVDLTQPLPFEDGTFDTILLSDVLEHIPTPQALVNEMFRVLKPGGTVLANTPFMYWVHEAPFDFHRYTQFALKRMGEEAGFTVPVIAPVGGLPETRADLCLKAISERLPKGGRIASLVQPFLSWKLRAFDSRFSKLTEDRFPLGYFFVYQK